MLFTMIGSVVSTVMIASAHAKTKEALQREQDRAEEAAFERARAEMSFQQARRAVDFFKLSAQEMPNWPELQTVRLKFLRAALEYYKEFIDQHGDDGFLQKDLAASYDTVMSLLGELQDRPRTLVFIGAACPKVEEMVRNHPGDHRFRDVLDRVHKSFFFMQAGCGTSLLTQEAVEDDLKLSEEQRAKVVQLTQQLEEQRREVFQEFQKLRPDDQRQRMDQMFEDNRKAVADILRPDQAQRLQELDWQAQGPMAFGNPEMVKELKLTDAQRKQIFQIHSESMPRPDFGPDGDHHRPPPPPSAGARQKTMAKIITVLDADQKAKWQRLTGEPFHGELHFGPPPGFRPHQ